MPSLALLALAIPFLTPSFAHSHPNPSIRDSTRHRNLALAQTRRDGTELDANPKLGGFVIVGDSGVSAQMMFLGTAGTVFMLDSE